MTQPQQMSTEELAAWLESKDGYFDSPEDMKRLALVVASLRAADKLREAVERIANYGHKPGCEHAGYVPVYECCAGSEDWPEQGEIARAALEAFNGA